MLISSVLTAALCAASCFEPINQNIDPIDQSIRSSIAEEKAFIMDCFRNNPKAVPSFDRNISFRITGDNIAEYLQVFYGGSEWHKMPAHDADCGGAYGLYKYEPREFVDPLSSGGNDLQTFFL